MLLRRYFFLLFWLMVVSTYSVIYLTYARSRWATSQSSSLLASLLLEAGAGPERTAPRPTDRIFCMILTKPDNFDTKAATTFRTWAHKCDLHRFISVIPDKYRARMPSTVKPNASLELAQNLTILQPAGFQTENYWKLTTKVLLAMRDIYNRYRDEFDWFLKADDDTFIFMDNLREFMRARNTSELYTYGYNFKVIVDKGYHSGGGGYLLTKEAFNRLGKKVNEDLNFCQNTGTEDVDIARCLRRLGVVPGKSIDDCGRERFHPLDIDYHIKGGFPNWLKSYAENPLKTDADCCSDSTISFHYMSQQMMQRLADVLKQYGKVTFREIMTYLFGTTTPAPPTTTSTKKSS